MPGTKGGSVFSKVFSFGSFLHMGGLCSLLCDPERQVPGSSCPRALGLEMQNHEMVWVGMGFKDHHFPTHGMSRKFSPWHQRHN